MKKTNGSHVDKQAYPTIPRKEALIVFHKQIRDLYALGWSMGEIADKLNCSKQTVHKVLSAQKATPSR